MTGTPVPQRYAEARRRSGQARMLVLPTEMETRVASENRPEVEKELEPRQPGQCPAKAIGRTRHTNRRWRRQWHAARAAQRTRYKKLRGIDLIDRKSTRLNSSHGYISYAVFCLKKKK